MKRFFGFSGEEIKALGVVFVILFIAVGLNLRTSVRRGRDAQRKSDLRAIYDAMQAYQKDNGTYPLSSTDGRIVACDAGVVDAQGFPVLRNCDWYKDSLNPYMGVLLGDPRQGQGRSYYYLSNGKHFQVYASLEGVDEDEYNPKIVARNLKCGDYLCNFGRSDGAVPLDISLEEYEVKNANDKK